MENKSKPITPDALRKACGVPERKSPTDPKEWGGKLNIYVCDRCRAHVVTRDVDEGVTPFLLPSSSYCPNKCGAEPKEWINMTSSFYRVWDQSMREDYQWYLPGPGDSFDPRFAEHVSKGGLLLRANAEAASG